MYNSRSLDTADTIVVARAPQTGPSPIALVLAACSRMWLEVGRELAMRRAARELEGLTDYQLRDIGISRGEIPYAVRHGREAL